MVCCQCVTWTLLQAAVSCYSAAYFSDYYCSSRCTFILLFFGPFYMFEPFCWVDNPEKNTFLLISVYFLLVHWHEHCNVRVSVLRLWVEAKRLEVAGSITSGADILFFHSVAGRLFVDIVGSSPGLIGSERETNHPPSSSAELEKDHNSTGTTYTSFLSCSLIS